MANDPDRFSVLTMAALQAFKYVVISVTILLGVVALRPLVEAIAGENTVFSFGAQLNVSIGVNIVAGVAVIELARQNRRLRKQVRRLEGGRTTAPVKSGKRTTRG